MSQATITLPLDSYNRLVDKAMESNQLAMNLAAQLEAKLQEPFSGRTPQMFADYIRGIISIMRSGTVEIKAKQDPTEPGPIPAPKSTTPKSRS